MNTQTVKNNVVNGAVKKVVIKKTYTPITGLFDKRSFTIGNYGICNGSNNKFLTLNDKNGKRVITFIATWYGPEKYGVYKRSMLYYSYDKPLQHNKEITIYGKKFIVLDKKSKKGDLYVIKADTHRLVGFVNELRKVIKFPNICL